MNIQINEQVKNHESVQYERKERLRKISIIMFWGAMWGILEVTVGNGLHMIPFRVPTGSVLFPIGYYFMQKAYSETKELKSIFYTACVVSVIKLINLLTPGVPIIRVVNPAICILFEGLSVVGVYKIFKHYQGPIKYIYAVIMSVLWRVGYYIICFSIFIPLSMMEASSIVEPSKFIEFFIINGWINSLIIYFYSKFAHKVGKAIKVHYRPVYSIALILIAMIIQWFG